ncbi:hypothetical protein CYMTET_46973 [Cymbomonas tetramitiformis]|uniref:DDB1- and CUL4-associated factor 15 WD40 repeat-containing domain-containing protein n=1 Tax=Cymbomonas tetramitiformis TaxID=36881 RepID=A0AAE0EY67_9CHLO|nr:hypothetical protein CYMTET_46973 [Cymbomonas tetramitiformis]
MRKRPINVLLRLRDRELCSKSARDKIYSKIPPRLVFRIEHILDVKRAVLDSVILGFTRDGRFLLSYSSNEAQYRLQAWEFSSSGPLCIRMDVPIFYQEKDSLAPNLRSSFGDAASLLESDGPDDTLRITVCETPDDNFLVVHGVAESPAESSSSSVNYISVLIHPRLQALPGRAASPPVSKSCVQSLQYCSALPDRGFYPARALLPGMLVLNDASAVTFFQYEVSDQAVDVEQEHSDQAVDVEQGAQ